MSDLHAGKGCPIGAAFLSQGWIYPALVGNDNWLWDGVMAYRAEGDKAEVG